MSSPEEDEYWNLQVKIINCGYYVYCCTLFIGLVGNITAIIVILCSKSFHTLTGFYLLSLSAADLLMLSTAVMFYVFGRQVKFFSQGEASQYIIEWACETSMIVSVWTVTTFTVERYLAICHPFFVQSLSKKSRVRQIILGIWLIGALLALIPTAVVVVENHGDAEVKLTNEKLMPYVADVWATLFFFMPILSMATMYVLIWVKLKRGSKEKQITRQKTNRADTRMLMMFVIIVAAFLLSWAPYNIYRVLYTHMVASKFRTVEFDDDFGTLVDNFYLANLSKQILFPLNTALNPIIFSLMSKKFRDALKALIVNGSRRFYNWSVRLICSRNNSNTVETRA